MGDLRLPVQLAVGSTKYSAERLVNCFVEQAADKKPIIVQTPGLTQYLAVSELPIRGIHMMGGVMYIVAGSSLYDQTLTELGTTVDGTGLVSMADNGTQLVIVTSSGNAYIYDGSFNEITDPDFPGATSVDYLDGYFIFSEPDSGSFFISAIYDGTSYDALDFASAESAPDDLVRVFVDHREVWLFGNETVEIWQNTGAASFPFERIPGAINEKGIRGKFTVTRTDNSIYWVDKDGVVRRAQGYDPIRISTHEVEHQIAQGSLESAEAFTYSQEGHEFYVLTVPGAGTFVYDAATQLWHERESYGLTHWRARCGIGYSGTTYVGDSETGVIYSLDLDVHTENGNFLVSEIVFPPIYGPSGRRFSISRVQLDMEPSVLTGMLSISEDGDNWGNELWRDCSGKRIVWQRLGQYHKAHLRFRFSDSVKRHLFHAYADIS